MLRSNRFLRTSPEVHKATYGLISSNQLQSTQAFCAVPKTRPLPIMTELIVSLGLATKRR
jgi:hypothetical protein